MDAVRYTMPDLGQISSGDRQNATNEDAERENIEVGPILGVRDESVAMKVATNFFLDAKLSGGPIQCSEEDGTCQQMEWVAVLLRFRTGADKQ